MALLPGLINYWKMDEASGTRFDSKGTNNLTDNNTVTSIAGVINNAAVFTLLNTEWLSAANLTLTAPYSYSFWAWSNAVIATNQECFSTPALFTYFVGTTGTLRCQPGVGTLTTAALSAAAWHHIVCVVNGASSAIYADNVQTLGNVSGNQNGAFAIGRVAPVGGELLDGRIDEVGVWNGRALTAGDVATLWNSGAGLAYPFGESGAKLSKLHLNIGIGI